MILVHGPDELLVRDVVRDLNQRGLLAQGLSADAHIFSEVVAHSARTVIGLLPQTPRVSEDDACELMQAWVEAATAPPAPRLVVVSPAPSEALHLHLLRRSGAPYVNISSAALAELVPPAYLPKQPVWLARDLLCAEHEVSTYAGLLDAIAAAVRDDFSVGVEHAPARTHWDQALHEAGVVVRVTPAWLARLRAMCGRPAMYRDASGKLITRFGYERIARALGALPRGQTA
jgi:hypothetical protein